MISRNFYIILTSIFLATTINTSFGMQTKKRKRNSDFILTENYQQPNSLLSCLPQPLMEYLTTNFLDWASTVRLQQTCRDLYLRAHNPYKTIYLDFYGKRKENYCAPFFSKVRQKLLQILNSKNVSNNKIYLNLSNNYIECRNLATFLKNNPKKLSPVLQKIIGLNLSQNPFYDLPEEIQLLPNLETIVIESNHTVKWINFSMLPKLKHLFLSSPLEVVEKTIGTNIETLSCQLPLPIKIDRVFPKLKTLTLIFSKYETLTPENIEALKSLKYLEKINLLCFSKYDVLFQKPFQLIYQLNPSRIRSFTMKGNNLNRKHLRKILNRLPNLEELNLESNNIENIPEEITQLSNLRILSLNGNNLRYLPKFINKLSNLEELTLPDDSTFEIYPEFIKDLPNLYQVNFTHCPYNFLSLLQDIVQIRKQYFQNKILIKNLIKTLGVLLLIQLPKLPEVNNNNNREIIDKLGKTLYNLVFVDTRLNKERITKETINSFPQIPNNNALPTSCYINHIFDTFPLPTCIESIKETFTSLHNISACINLLNEKIRYVFSKKIPEFNSINESLENLTTRASNLFTNIESLESGVTVNNAVNLINILRNLSHHTQSLSRLLNIVKQIINPSPRQILPNVIVIPLTKKTTSQGELSLTAGFEHLEGNETDSSDDDSRQLKRQKTKK